MVFGENTKNFRMIKLFNFKKKFAEMHNVNIDSLEKYLVK